MEDYSTMGYRTLQQKTKALRLPANYKRVYLIELLVAKSLNDEDEIKRIIEHVKWERQQTTTKTPTKRTIQSPEISSSLDVRPIAPKIAPSTPAQAPVTLCDRVLRPRTNNRNYIYMHDPNDGKYGNKTSTRSPKPKKAVKKIQNNKNVDACSYPKINNYQPRLAPAPVNDVNNIELRDPGLAGLGQVSVKQQKAQDKVPITSNISELILYDLMPSHNNKPNKQSKHQSGNDVGTKGNYDTMISHQSGNDVKTKGHYDPMLSHQSGNAVGTKGHYDTMLSHQSGNEVKTKGHYEPMLCHQSGNDVKTKGHCDPMLSHQSGNDVGTKGHYDPMLSHQSGNDVKTKGHYDPIISHQSGNDVGTKGHYNPMLSHQSVNDVGTKGHYDPMLSHQSGNDVGTKGRDYSRSLQPNALSVKLQPMKSVLKQQTPRDQSKTQTCNDSGTKIHLLVRCEKLKPMTSVLKQQVSKKNLSGPLKQNLYGLLKQNLSRSLKQNLSGPLKQNLSRPSNQNPSRHSKQNLSRPLKQNLSGHLKQNLSRPLKQNLSGHLKQNLSRPLKQNLSGPLKQNLSEHLKQNLSGPLKQNLSGPSKQNLSKNLGPSQSHGRAYQQWNPAPSSSYSNKDSHHINKDKDHSTNTVQNRSYLINKPEQSIVKYGSAYANAYQCTVKNPTDDERVQLKTKTVKTPQNSLKNVGKQVSEINAGSHVLALYNDQYNKEKDITEIFNKQTGITERYYKQKTVVRRKIIKLTENQEKFLNYGRKEFTLQDVIDSRVTLDTLNKRNDSISSMDISDRSDSSYYSSAELVGYKGESNDTGLAGPRQVLPSISTAFPQIKPLFEEVNDPVPFCPMPINATDDELIYLNELLFTPVQSDNMPNELLSTPASCDNTPNELLFTPAPSDNTLNELLFTPAPCDNTPNELLFTPAPCDNTPNELLFTPASSDNTLNELLFTPAPNDNTHVFVSPANSMVSTTIQHTSAPENNTAAHQDYVIGHESAPFPENAQILEPNTTEYQQPYPNCSAVQQEAIQSYIIGEGAATTNAAYNYAFVEPNHDNDLSVICQNDICENDQRSQNDETYFRNGSEFDTYLLRSLYQSADSPASTRDSVISSQYSPDSPMVYDDVYMDFDRMDFIEGAFCPVDCDLGNSPYMYDDAFEVASQDGDYMERIMMENAYSGVGMDHVTF